MRLESDKLPFGSIILNSTVSKKLNLTNFGDVGSKFQWSDAFKPHFSVTPSEGFVAAHSSVTLDVTFQPRDIGNDIRFENVPCLVDGNHYTYFFTSFIYISNQNYLELVSVILFALSNMNNYVIAMLCDYN